MRILLDTSYVYALMMARWDLSETEKLIFSRKDVRFHVSAVSIWEMRLKFNARDHSGKRRSEFDPEDVVELLAAHDVIFLPMTAGHAACRLKTPIAHRDPFDEFLLVQAQQENLKLLTTDRQIIGHPLAVSPDFIQ